MTALHKNRVQMSVASVGADPYTITLDAASSGYQSFATAYGANATVDILVTMGTTWEVARNCTYTHSGTTVTRGTLEASSTGSRITTFDNTAVVSVIFTAGKGNLVESALLEHVAGTDADTTMTVGSMYVVDMSAWATADRTYTLPATAVAGDRVGIMVTAGDASHELIITAASGDTLNGVAGGTEWSRLFITGEVVIMRCVTADSAWIVEYDGRVPCIWRFTNPGMSMAAINTVYYPDWTVSIDNASLYTNATNDCATIRRAGNYSLSTAWLSHQGATAKQYYSRIYEDPNGTPVVLGPEMRNSSGASASRIGQSLSGVFAFVAGDAVTGGFVQTDTTSVTSADIGFYGQEIF